LKTAPDEVAARVETLLAERKRLEKELGEAKTALALSGGSGPKAEAENVNGVSFMGQVIAGIEPKALRGLADDQMKAIGTGIVAIVAANETSNTVVVAVSEALHGKITAPDLVRAATAAMGGQGGGGRCGSGFSRARRDKGSVESLTFTRALAASAWGPRPSLLAP
jgi:alanyl-tRNA synthetase